MSSTTGREAWMRRAVEVARSSLDSADVPVGAIVFGPDGAELAAACNERERTGDPTAHAEVLALRRAAAVTGSWRLTGCTLVVTLEPCTMCAGAIVLARVARVVFGAWEPKTGAVGSLWDVVRDRRLNHRPEVYPGVLADETAELMRAFFRRRSVAEPVADADSVADPVADAEPVADPDPVTDAEPVRSPDAAASRRPGGTPPSTVPGGA